MACYKSASLALQPRRHLGILLVEVHLNILSRVYYVQYCRGPKRLQLLYQLSYVPPKCKGAVDTLGRKIIQFLMVGVHHYLLLVGVLKWLHSRQAQNIVLLTRHRVHAPVQPDKITPQHVQQYSLCYIIGVVASNNLITS